MRYGVIAVAVMSVSLGTTAPSAYGDTAYGVGTFMGIDAFSGICSLDTDTSTAQMLVPTPGVSWYGATDGPSPGTFYAVANPWYDYNNPDKASRAAPKSELFLIDTADWSVNFVGFITAPIVGGEPGGPIREIGMDDSTSPGTLYGTDYANLYTIPTTGGTAAFVGTFGTQPGTTDLIDYAFSMDYDQGVGQLLGTSWQRDDDQTDLYYFDRGTGAGTQVGYTGIDFISDVWQSHDSGTLFGVSSGPGRILEIDPLTGAALQIGTFPDVRFNGMANATLVSSEPLPFVTTPVPLTNLGYETTAYVDIDATVDAGGVEDFQTDDDSDYHLNAASTAVPDQASASLQNSTQNTNASATIDLSNDNGMLTISSIMTAESTGTDSAGVNRYSGVLGTTSILQGSIGVPAGETPNVLFGATVRITGWITSWFDGGSVLFGPDVYRQDGMQPTWDLRIWHQGSPDVVYLNVDETSDTWSFSFGVPAGQVLMYEFFFDGFFYGKIEAGDPDNDDDDVYVPNMDSYLLAEVTFGAAVPEPTTMLLLCSGVIPILLKKRRRRS